MKKILFSTFFLLSFLKLYAQPGKDGTLTVSASTQIVNQYSPISASITIGDNTLSIATTSIITLCEGDLIMVYQAQGATLNFTNSALYGDITAYNSAGLYEFKYVQAISGNIITTQTTFTNSYLLQGRPQVIKVPQYSTLTINPGASIIPKPWKDTTIALVPYRFGGLVVIHAANIVNNGIITADGSGFRGGVAPTNGLANFASTLYVSNLIANGGEKGEGIFGNQTDYDLNGGRYGRGAPANGGGGGTTHNSGGGGGGNGLNGNIWSGSGVMVVNGSNLLTAWALDPDFILNGNALTNSSGGGRGGYTYGSVNANANVNPPGAAIWSGDFRRNVGGFGGRPLTNINAETRIYFGGGGGAGSNNNNATTPAGIGGGIVYLIATAGVSGTGTITSNGQAGGNTIGCNCDGASGGGGGGSLVIKTPALPGTQALTVVGGKGGDENYNFATYTVDESLGPGGGGGGGFAAVPALAPTPSVGGGIYGISLSLAVTEMLSNGSTQGATGQTVTVLASFITYVPITPTLLASNSPVCTGATINFTNTSGTTYTWTGPNGFSSSVQNPSIPNATALMAGTYTAAITNTGSCQLLSTGTIAVIVNPSPTLGVSNSVVCPGTTGTLIATGANSYTWNPGPLIGNSVTINPLSTTVYTVTGTSVPGCTAIATKVITVPTTMTVSINASPTTSTCVGNNITLTANTAGGNPFYSYTWTAGPLSSNYLTTQPAGSYIYTVTSKDFNNCLSVTTISLNFVALPVVSVPSISICPGTAGTLTASGATTYTWRPGNFIVNPYVTSPPINSSYTVTGASAGCTAAATASIIIKPLPVLSFVTATITCANLGSATVTATGGAFGPFSYSWTPTGQTTSVANNLFPGVYTLSVFDAGTGCTSVSTTTFTPLIPFTGTVSASTSVACNAMNTGTADIVLAGGSGLQSYSWSNLGGPQTTPSATNLSAGIHTVTVIDGVTFCALTETFQITQPQPLYVNTTQSSASACVGDSIVLSATGSGGTPGYTFQWISGPANYLYKPIETVPGPYTYKVLIKDANNCKDSTNVTVSFFPYPNVTVMSQTICSGGTATLTATGAQAYSWYPGGFTGNVLYVTAANTFTILGVASGCPGYTTASVTVNGFTVPVISVSGNFCEGNSINFSTTSTGTYKWVGPNGFNSTNQNPFIGAVTLINAGAYSLTVTDTTSGCSASTFTNVIVRTNPVASVTGASVCIGESVITASGGVSYSWSGPNNFVSNQANAFIPVVNLNSAGPYLVSVIGANGCLSGTVVQVVAYDFPLPIPAISGPSKICLNSKVKLQGNGGGTYLWKGPSNFVSTQQTLDFTVVSLNMAGIYTLTVKNASNCAASATVPITVYPLPLATLTSKNDKTCVPLCTDFGLVHDTDNVAPVVKTTFVVQGLWASDSAFRYCIQVGGKHLVTAFYTDTNSCLNTSTLNLTVYPQPVANFDYFPQEPIENVDEVIFSNSSSGENQNKWHWYFNKNGDYTSELQNTQYIFEKPGAHPVALIVTNTWGCSDTVVKSIVVEEEFSLYIPNAFTPNGDDKNDLFQPKGIGIVTYNLQIYGRWGEKLFTSSDFLKGWDGSYKGNACPNDVYLWRIEVTNFQGKTKNIEGYVNLVY